MAWPAFVALVLLVVCQSFCLGSTRRISSSGSRTLLDSALNRCVWENSCFLGSRYLADYVSAKNVSAGDQTLKFYVSRALTCSSILTIDECNQLSYCSWDASSPSPSYGCSLQESELNQLQQQCISPDHQTVLAVVQSCRSSTLRCTKQQQQLPASTATNTTTSSSSGGCVSVARCVLTTLIGSHLDVVAVLDAMVSEVMPKLEALQYTILGPPLAAAGRRRRTLLQDDSTQADAPSNPSAQTIPSSFSTSSSIPPSVSAAAAAAAAAEAAAAAAQAPASEAGTATAAAAAVAAHLVESMTLPPRTLPATPLLPLPLPFTDPLSLLAPLLPPIPLLHSDPLDTATPSSDPAPAEQHSSLEPDYLPDSETDYSDLDAESPTAVSRRLQKLLDQSTTPHEWSSAYYQQRLSRARATDSLPFPNPLLPDLTLPPIILPPPRLPDPTLPDPTTTDTPTPTPALFSTAPPTSEEPPYDSTLQAPTRETLADTKYPSPAPPTTKSPSSPPPSTPTPATTSSPPSPTSTTKPTSKPTPTPNPTPTTNTTTPTAPAAIPLANTTLQKLLQDPAAAAQLLQSDADRVAQRLSALAVPPLAPATRALLANVSQDLASLADFVATEILVRQATQWDPLQVAQEAAAKLHTGVQRVVCGMPDDTASRALLQAPLLQLLGLELTAVQAHWAQLVVRSAGSTSGWVVDNGMGVLAGALAYLADVEGVCEQAPPAIPGFKGSYRAVSGNFSVAVAQAVVMLTELATGTTPEAQQAASSWLPSASRHLQDAARRAVLLAALTEARPSGTDALDDLLASVPQLTTGAELQQLLTPACGLLLAASKHARRLVNWRATADADLIGDGAASSKRLVALVGAMEELVKVLSSFVVAAGGAPAAVAKGLGLELAMNARMCALGQAAACGALGGLAGALQQNATLTATEHVAVQQLLVSATQLAANCSQLPANSTCTSHSSCSAAGTPPPTQWTPASEHPAWAAVWAGPYCRMDSVVGLVQGDAWEDLVRSWAVSSSCDLLLDVLPTCDALPATDVCARNPTCGSTSWPLSASPNMRRTALLSAPSSPPSSPTAALPTPPSASGAAPAVVSFMPAAAGAAGERRACLPIWDQALLRLLGEEELAQIQATAAACTAQLDHSTCEPLTAGISNSTGSSSSSSGSSITVLDGQQRAAPASASAQFFSKYWPMLVGVAAGAVAAALVALVVQRWRLRRAEYNAHLRRTRKGGKRKRRGGHGSGGAAAAAAAMAATSGGDPAAAEALAVRESTRIQAVHPAAVGALRGYAAAAAHRVFEIPMHGVQRSVASESAGSQGAASSCPDSACSAAARYAPGTPSGPLAPGGPDLIRFSNSLTDVSSQPSFTSTQPSLTYEERPMLPNSALSSV